MKLNGWQRVGLVLSVLWLLAVLASGFDRAPYFIFGATIGIWLYLPDLAFATPSEYMAAASDFTLRGFAIVGLLPVLFTWLTTYLAVFAYRWIAAGFKGDGDTNGRG
jgi:hypothetical protein